MHEIILYNCKKCVFTQVYTVCMCVRACACMCYLRRVNEVEGLVESEVHEAKQCGVELCESGHDSVIHIRRMLNVNTHTHTFNYTYPQHGCTDSKQCALG